MLRRNDPRGQRMTYYEDDEQEEYSENDTSDSDYDGPYIWKKPGYPDLYQEGNVVIPEWPDISPEYARDLAKQRSKAIFTAYNELQAILERHEMTIRKRWIKKNVEQRKKILLGAWPNMNQYHRPDWKALTLEMKERKRNRGDVRSHFWRMDGTKFLQAYQYPHINIEDLSKPKNILLMLNSRGRNFPHHFAMGDLHSAHFGILSSSILPYSLESHSVLLGGRETVDTYGEIKSWEDDPNLEHDTLTKREPHGGESLLVMEIQQKLLEFLVKFSKDVLHDLSKKTSLSDKKYPVQPEPERLSDEFDDGFTSIKVLKEEGPYRVPGDLDFKRLVALVGAKRNEAEDHLWALREDPGYFHEFFVTQSIHRQEHLRDEFGRTHERLDTTDFWEFILKHSISHSLEMLEYWNTIFVKTKEVMELRQKYDSEISPEKPLPEEFKNKLLAFKYCLTNQLFHPLKNLNRALSSSPGMRGNWERIPSEPGSTMIHTKLTDTGVKNTTIHLFARLMYGEMQVKDEQEYSFVIDEIERRVRTDRSVQESLTEWVQHEFSEVAFLVELISQINAYQPYSATFEYLMDDDDYVQALEEAYDKDTSFSDEIRRAIVDIELEKLGNPTDGRFNYPADKKATKATIEQMQQAELNLDTFWDDVFKYIEKSSGKKMEDLVHLHAKEGLSVKRTTDWVENEAGTNQPGVPQAESKAFDEQFKRLSVNPDVPSQFSEDDKLSKEKTKTRGTAAPDTPKRPTLADTVAEIPKIEPFAVDSRSYKVFSTLFHSQWVGGVPGEVPWTEFIRAMVACSFQVEKLYGSVWQFTPTNMDIARSIQFHEPHPVAKIPYRIARRIGRRLNRAYGWTSDMFVKEEGK